MPTFNQLRDELEALGPDVNVRGAWLDAHLKSSVANVAKVSGRPTVLYAARWTQEDTPDPNAVMVLLEDVHFLMDSLHGLHGRGMDLILHSGGGDPNAAEAFIKYLRTRFENVRVIVPLAAMSAATMMACGADSIVMGKHSYLGPIDPQTVLMTPLGRKVVAAHAVLEQWRRAQSEAANPAKFAAWLPMLQQYGPALVIECENATKLSEQIVVSWLAKYMFRGAPDAQVRAELAGKKLNEHNLHLTHGRFLDREFARNDLGLTVEDLETSQEFQDAVLTAFHVTTLTFAIGPRIAKIFQNSTGKTSLKIISAGGP